MTAPVYSYTPVSLADDLSRRKREIAWGDRFMPEIQQILAPFTMIIAPEHNDFYEATDIISLQKDVAVRMRRHGYYERYPNQFTVRYKVVYSKQLTEMEKLVNGYADYMFYGHADVTETKVAHYYLIDMNRFRAALINLPEPARRSLYEDKENREGTVFRVFKLDCFPKDVVVSSR